MTNTVEVKNTKTKKNKKRKIASLEKKKARAGWIFILPFVLGFILVYFPIVFESLRSSLFYTVRVDGVRQEQFNAFISYFEAFTDVKATINGSNFAQILLSGVGDIILDIPMILLFSLFMAVLLNQKMVGRAAFRAIFFVPVILSTGIMTAIDASSSIDTLTNAGSIDDGSGQNASNQLVDAVNMQKLFEGISVTDGMLNYVTGAINDIFNIVNRSGVQMLIFLAGLQSISPAIYESVQIDGASAWETFWKITFPMISPMILANLIYTVIDTFVDSENPVMEIVMTQSRELNYGLSAAMAWVYFAIVAVALGIIVLIVSKFVFYEND